MKILLVEPYATGSHLQWAEGYQRHSRHQVDLLKLPGRHWKWRMHGAAITLAKEYERSNIRPDLILATDMLDVSAFLGLLRNQLRDVPVAMYFHENQITYPWSVTDSDTVNQRDHHYGHINFTSALSANKVFFNSDYHLRSFLNALPTFLRMFPDHQNTDQLDGLTGKSSVMHLGIDLREMGNCKHVVQQPKRAVILWNHRWEYDKNPEEFFEVLFRISERGWDFKLVVLGESFGIYPKIFDVAKERLKDHILHWGYVSDRSEYVYWLQHSDILPVTCHQDFFGGSVVEAMYMNVKPLLPHRLAYPEHIPSQLHGTFFYNEGELTDKLQRWIMDVSVLRKQQTRSFVEKYDWSVVADHMDSVFEQMLAS